MISTIKEELAYFIQGPAGQIELMMSEPIAKNHHALGIVCHPHPLFGGTMHNKVVTTLVKTFQHLGLNTIRFNFRGVGLSEGEFDNAVGELDDLLAVVAWVRREDPAREIWLAGFSFGSYIATMAATQIPVTKLVVVAPPVQNFFMQKLPPVLCPWVLVQGDLDDVVSPDEAITWGESCVPKPVIIRMPEAGHFFHGQLSELQKNLLDVL
jgi:alpha/beta superfamily hydrolase